MRFIRYCTKSKDLTRLNSCTLTKLNMPKSGTFCLETAEERPPTPRTLGTGSGVKQVPCAFSVANLDRMELNQAQGSSSPPPTMVLRLNLSYSSVSTSLKNDEGHQGPGPQVLKSNN